MIRISFIQVRWSQYRYHTPYTAMGKLPFCTPFVLALLSKNGGFKYIKRISDYTRTRVRFRFKYANVVIPQLDYINISEGN